MADQPKTPDSGSLLKRALSAISQLEAKLADLENARREPIAIVGMACRFPGANSPNELWANLVAGVDSVTVVPPYRWDAEAFYDPDPDAPGKAYTKWGGFIGDVEHFDAAFFGITSREAVMLDPQQRLLLEMVWDALEDANMSPSALAGANGGVFLGMSSSDFMQLVSRAGNPEYNNAYLASGTAHSIAGGRISYFLGIHGPNIAVDTACSSSLVAVHLGVKSLRNREADFAIAAGVNLTLLPDASIMTSRARMMSPTGRCNTFDESADGYVRSEGCGVVVLKRLSDARRAGDRILALIRGTAINQDGRSSGLTAPHGPSQEAVIRAALADGGLTPDDVSFVEAHGTGTSLGDPIEINSLARVFARKKTDRPLVVGAIKANIGHTEPAAGIAGLIKAVQALRHRAMPKQIHLHKRNPHINWDAVAIEPPLETTQLKPPPGKTLIGAVSSFGFSGTNSHVVLEEAPPVAAGAVVEPTPTNTPALLAFSARTTDAVNELAGRYANMLDAPGAPLLHEMAAAAPVARSQFPERIGIVAADTAEASLALRAVANGGASPNAVRGRTLAAASPEIVFLFTGQGAQYPGMGRALYDDNAAFRDAIDACDMLAQRLMGRSLKDIMFGLNGAGDLVNDTTYTQPALFAIEYALVAAWRAWGVEPTAVMGHSVGEYTAACVAGMLSLEDAMRLIVARGALMGALPCGGAMAAVFAPEDVVRSTIAPAGARLGVAGVNGPTNIVISGAADAVADACARFAKSGVETQALNVSHAFHSALMDPILDEFETVASEATLNAPRLMLMSNISGARMGPEGRRPEYWRKHLREAVRFSDSIAGLQRGGYRLFLEIGPTPILTGMAQRCGGADMCAYIPSLRKGRDDRRSMLEAAGRLYAAGAQLNWTGVVGSPKKHTDLPRYPFQRQRYWPEGSAGATSGTLAGIPSGGLKDWCFGVEWRVAEASAQPADLGGQNWLIFADRGGVGAAFATDLRAKGATCVLLERPGVWDARAVEAALTEAAPVDRPLHGVASFWALDARNDFADSADLDREVLGQTTAALISLRAVVERAARVLVVTRGVQQVGNRGTDVVQSALWAFAGVVASEHPTCGLVRIDIDPERDSNAAATLAREAAASDHEDRVVYRGGQRYVARLAGQTLEEPASGQTARPRADGAYIVTGGLTGLGLATAQWLVEKGAGGLVLLGRRAPGAEAAAAIKQMEASGARVSVAQADIGDQDKLAALLKDVRETIGPIRGVFHAAGVLDDAMLSEQTPERIARVLAPKVRGGWALHALTLGDPIDFFVLFSSAAALFGSPGQSNYAAANGFLDGLAAYRQARGLPGLAINWGSWAEIGMAAGVSSEHHRRWAAMGLEMITPEAGVDMLDQLVMKSVRPQMAAVPITRSKIAAGGPAFYRELMMRGSKSAAEEVTPDVLGALRSAAPDARRGVLEAFVMDQVRGSLALPTTQKVDLHETLLNLGMDSLMAMDLRNRLQKAVGVRLDVAYLLGGATSTELIGTLTSKLSLEENAAALEPGWEAELI